MPDLAAVLYNLLAYGLELRPEGFAYLVKEQMSQSQQIPPTSNPDASTEIPVVVSGLGRLLRHGIFNLAEATINSSCLEAVTYLAEFCVRPNTSTTDAAAVNNNRNLATVEAIRRGLPLGTDLVRELLSLVTRPVFPKAIEDTLSRCIFALARLDPVSVSRLSAYLSVDVEVLPGLVVD